MKFPGWHHRTANIIPSLHSWEWLSEDILESERMQRTVIYLHNYGVGMPYFINAVQQEWIWGEESLVHKIVVFDPCKCLIEKGKYLSSIINTSSRISIIGQHKILKSWINSKLRRAKTVDLTKIKTLFHLGLSGFTTFFVSQSSNTW